MAETSPPGAFTFREPFLSTSAISFWFHIDLWHRNDIFSDGLNREAGQILLRCNETETISRDRKEEILADIKKVCSLGQNQLVKPSSGRTVGLFKTTFRESEMVYAQLAKRVIEFAGCFGDFNPF